MSKSHPVYLESNVLSFRKLLIYFKYRIKYPGLLFETTYTSKQKQVRHKPMFFY